VYNDHRPGRKATGIGQSCALSCPSGAVDLPAKKQRLWPGGRLTQEARQTGAVHDVRCLGFALTRDMPGFSSTALNHSMEFVTTEASGEER
jgi:hypothetical protein